MLDRLPETATDDRAAGKAPTFITPDRTKKPVLIVLHQENSNPGHVGQWFARNGHALDIRKPRFGDKLPETMAEHCGAVIFGGPMSANDKDDFICAETDWVGVALKEQAPFLGICLGAQMLANHLGAKVDFDPHAHAEIGYYPLITTDEGKQIGPFPDHVYQWHREGCDLPSGGRLLATSNGPFPVQAFAYGPSAIGVQFHPEITFAQVHRWSGHNNTRMQIKGAHQREQHIAGHIMHGHKVRTWLDQFLTRWTKNELSLA